MFVRRDNDAGAGLGLTIARTFVEAHGQRIWVEDAPGGGARFCFTLPAAASLADEREGDEPEGDEPEGGERELAQDSHR